VVRWVPGGAASSPSSAGRRRPSPSRSASPRTGAPISRSTSPASCGTASRRGSGMSHAGGAASPWLLRWAHLIRPGGRVLDLAAGGGRHSRWLAGHGFAVTAVDRDGEAMAALADVAETLVADLEGAPWPLADRRFDAVLVTNYLWRPLFPAIVAALDAGGILLY